MRRIVLFLTLLLMASVAQAADIQLAWDQGAGGPTPKGYKLYVSTAPGAFAKHTSVIDVGNALVGTVPGLTPGKTYYFAATAYTATGESPPSNEIAVLVAILEVPMPPGALHVAPVGGE